MGYVFGGGFSTCQDAGFSRVPYTYDVSSQEVTKFTVGDNAFFDCIYNSGGNLQACLTSYSGTENYMLFNASTGEYYAAFKAETADILALSNDGRMYATCRENGASILCEQP